MNTNLDLVTATAPGKAILFGEHAVVYAQPAIAVPVYQVQATVTVESAATGSGLTLSAVDLGRTLALAEAPADDPLAAMVRLTLAHLNASPPDVTLLVRSTIPIASGLGSGAAVSVAIVRALSACLGYELAPTAVSRLVYEVERLYHGTPSGIDNTVVAFGTPVYFVRGRRLETFAVGAALHLLIGDTGVASLTRIVVGDVRRAWESEPVRYEQVFQEVGRIVGLARQLIEDGGDVGELGELMNHNHVLLCQMGVSSPELERLVTAARVAGALGAKLSGGGRGGNMIALVAPGGEAAVSSALRRAGAVRVIGTVVPAFR